MFNVRFQVKFLSIIKPDTLMFETLSKATLPILTFNISENNLTRYWGVHTSIDLDLDVLIAILFARH